MPLTNMRQMIFFMVVSIFSITFSQDPVFTLTPDNFESVMEQRGEVDGDVAVVEQPVNGIDFSGNGHIIIRDFNISQDEFTIESKLYLTGYADSDPYISSVVSAWNPDHRNAYLTEGIDFRIGGGYNYPLLPDNAYDGVDDYVRPGNDRYVRAKLSKCIGEMVLGTDESPWKENFTDCCLPLNEWVHMVTTWDGEEVRLFINGRDATDGWRSSGIDIPAFYKSVQDLYIGTDNWSSARDINGYLGILNVYDKALSFGEIREKYRASLPEGSCRIIAEVLSPRPGEVILPSTKLTFEVSVEGECTLEDFIAEEYVVEFSNDPEFTTILFSTVVTMRDLLLSELQYDVTQGFETAMFIRIIPHQKALAKIRSGMEISITSLAVPVVFDTTDNVMHTTKKTFPPHVKNAENSLLGSPLTTVYDLYGRQIDPADTKSFSTSTGIYIIKSAHSSVKIMKYGR